MKNFCLLENCWKLCLRHKTNEKKYQRSKYFQIQCEFDYCTSRWCFLSLFVFPVLFLLWNMQTEEKTRCYWMWYLCKFHESACLVSNRSLFGRWWKTRRKKNHTEKEKKRQKTAYQKIKQKRTFEMAVRRWSQSSEEKERKAFYCMVCCVQSVTVLDQPM